MSNTTDWEKELTITCKTCEGLGYGVVHDPRDQTGETPMQVQCDDCHAEGKYMTLDAVRTIITQTHTHLLEVFENKRQYTCQHGPCDSCDTTCMYEGTDEQSFVRSGFNQGIDAAQALIRGKMKRVLKKNNVAAFIEDAIKGGWKPEKGMADFMATGPSCAQLATERTLLDPLAWQAVGKTRKWGQKMISVDGVRQRDTYRVQWHWFIDALADGKSIDEELEAIG